MDTFSGDMKMSIIILRKNPIFEELGKLIRKINALPLFQSMVASLLYLVGVFTMMIIGVEFVDWTINIARSLVG